MTDDEDSQPGYRVEGDVGAGLGGGDDEPTLVIVPRIPRPTLSKGFRLIATSFGELRKSVHEFTDVFDETTRLGALEMSHGESREVREFLIDAKRRINGVLSCLSRATRPPSKTGTNGETP